MRMIDIVALQKRIVDGLHDHVKQYGVTAIIERDQAGDKPKYPFIGIKWLTIIPEIGMDRRTRAIIPSDDPRFPKDVEYRYVRSPRVTLSVTAFDRDGTRIHTLSQAAHEWFSIPEFANDWLEPYDTTIVSTLAIEDRDTMLDREVERRQGFDVRMRVLNEVRVKVPTIERVEITGMDGVREDVDL